MIINLNRLRQLALKASHGMRRDDELGRQLTLMFEVGQVELVTSEPEPDTPQDGGSWQDSQPLKPVPSQTEFTSP